jgi:hypothetical protein
MKQLIILIGISVLCVSSGCIEQKVEVEQGTRVVCNECEKVIREDVKKSFVPLSRKSAYKVDENDLEICYSCAVERKNEEKLYLLGNFSTKIVHDPECYAAKKIKKSNRVYFENKSSARRAGYTACKICKP